MTNERSRLVRRLCVHVLLLLASVACYAIAFAIRSTIFMTIWGATFGWHLSQAFFRYRDLVRVDREARLQRERVIRERITLERDLLDHAAAVRSKRQPIETVRSEEN